MALSLSLSPPGAGAGGALGGARERKEDDRRYWRGQRRSPLIHRLKHRSRPHSCVCLFPSAPRRSSNTKHSQSVPFIHSLRLSANGHTPSLLYSQDANFLILLLWHRLQL